MSGTPKTDNPTRGIVLIIVATMIFSMQDALTKHLAQEYAVPQILWVRYLLFAGFALVLSVRTRPLRQSLKSSRPILQIVRSLIIVVEIGLFALAVRVLPLADTHALVSSFPLMVTALSAFFLAEYVGVRRWSAVCVGFLGVMVILRPGLTVLQPAALIALSTAFLFAVYHVMTRVVSRDDDSETSLLYMAVVGAVVLTAIGPFYWTTPSPMAALMMLILAVSGTVGHFILIKALELAPASVLQPFNYMMLVWAMLVGYFVFGDFPDLWTIGGGAVIVASGLYIIYREQLRRTPRTVKNPTQPTY